MRPYVSKTMCVWMRFQSKKETAKLKQKLPQFGSPGGVQRTRFSLTEPLLRTPWRPRRPRSAPGEALIPSKAQKVTKCISNPFKIVEMT